MRRKPSCRCFTRPRLKARVHGGSRRGGDPPPYGRAPECGAANPVRARTVAPRSQTHSFIDRQTFRQFGESRSENTFMRPRLQARRIRPKLLFWPKPFLFAREKAGKPHLHKQRGKPTTSYTYNRLNKCTFPLSLPHIKRKTTSPTPQKQKRKEPLHLTANGSFLFSILFDSSLIPSPTT